VNKRKRVGKCENGVKTAFDSFKVECYRQGWRVTHPLREKLDAGTLELTFAPGMKRVVMKTLIYPCDEDPLWNMMKYRCGRSTLTAWQTRPTPASKPNTGSGDGTFHLAVAATANPRPKRVPPGPRSSVPGLANEFVSFPETAVSGRRDEASLETPHHRPPGFPEAPRPQDPTRSAA